MNANIGFIQGRLVDKVNGNIQAFPWQEWQSEFVLSKEAGLHMMEWTLDQEDLYKNPLMTAKGQEEIVKLQRQYSLSIPSLTGDCFMQAPFYKVEGQQQQSLLKDLDNIIKACEVLKIEFIVLPLVDNGSLATAAQAEVLHTELHRRSSVLNAAKIKIAFESDYPAIKLADFIADYDKTCFGINYDSGNSAALGYDVSEEIAAYGSRVLNVHIKDRILGGTTVPLGEGNTNFEALFEALKSIDYQGNYILQTARSENNEHIKAIVQYKEMVEKWLDRYGLTAKR